MGKISLILVKNSGQGTEISNLVESITWKGRQGSASRSLQVTLIDDPGYRHNRSEIDVEQGHQVLFTYDGNELFRGLIMSQTQSDSKTMTFKAYDNGIRLSNNKDTSVYTNVTADQVFQDVCTRFGLPYTDVSPCSYVIPELTKSKTTAFDAICDALSLDFDATGIRHYVACERGNLKLLTRRENILQWVLDGNNITSYSYERSIEDIKTRIKMVSKEDTTIAQAQNDALESKIGIFQDIQKPDEGLTTPQINDLIASVLAEESTPERNLSVNAVGIPDVISGIGVYVIIDHLGLSRTFYVDEDTHSFQDNSHTMSLKLSYASDLTKSTGTSNGYSIGNIVQFHGGYHYVSSNATTPTGSQCKAGPARITLIANGAKHPYHLIHTDGQSRVYGWVDAGSFS